MAFDGGYRLIFDDKIDGFIRDFTGDIFNECSDVDVDFDEDFF